MKQIAAVIVAAAAGFGFGFPRTTAAQTATSDTTPGNQADTQMAGSEAEAGVSQPSPQTPEGNTPSENQDDAQAPGAGAEAGTPQAPAQTPAGDATPSQPPINIQAPNGEKGAGASPAPEAGTASPDNAAPAAPQNAEGPRAPESSGGIATVIVTARRTAENLQSVPVAITAFSEKDLQREQINSGQDLQGRVPSMVVSPGSQQRGIESPSIRGQGTGLGSSPGVIIYYDEVALPADFFSNAQGGPGKFFDLGNIQVLKGPQGTLFGKNTTGGALLLEPHKPDFTYSASLRTELSDYSGRGIEAIYNKPLSDTLSLRIGGKYFYREGFTKDVATGKDYDDKDFWTVRLGLMWKPADGVENYLLGYYTDSNDHGTSDVIEAVNPIALTETVATLAGTFGITLPPQIKTGCLLIDIAAKSMGCGQNLVTAQQARGVRLVQLSANPNQYLNTGALIDKFSYDLNDQMTLRNIASAAFMKYHYRWDQDGSAAPLDDLNAPDDKYENNQLLYTEELQLQGKAWDEKLKYVVGGYYEDMRPGASSEEFDSKAFGLMEVVTSFTLTHRAYGPFAQATYNLGGLSDMLDGLSVTLGGRYTKDKVEGTSTNTDHPEVFKGSAVTYTAGLDYKLAESLIYSKVSRGYKAGGFSPAAATEAHFSFQPEFVTNYEIGHKIDFTIGDVPARVNSAVYYSNYTNMQRSSGDNSISDTGQLKFGQAMYNAGKAYITGAEIEGMVQPLEGLALSANYGFMYGKYQQYDLLVGTILPQLDCSGQRIPAGQVAHLQCMPFSAVPRHQFSTSARYQLPIPESLGQLEGSLTFVWIDSNYTATTTLPQVEPGAWIGPYGLLNASFNWDRIDGTPLSLQLYGTNLTDRTYRISNSNVWELLGFQSSIYGEPRMVGLQMGYSWGE
jgi:iron complex outermembrane receptor protein